MLYLRRHYRNHLGFFLCYLLGVFSYVFYGQVYVLSWMNFYKRSASGVFFFACGCPVVSASFIKQIIFVPQCYLPFVKEQMTMFWGFPGGSDGKESVYNAGYLGSIPGLGRFPGERHGNPLCVLIWSNAMDRGAWRATVHGVAKSQT